MEDVQNGMEWKIWKMKRKIVIHTSILPTYIQSYNKLLSNPMDTAYQCESVAYYL